MESCHISAIDLAVVPFSLPSPELSASAHQRLDDDKDARSPLAALGLDSLLPETVEGLTLAATGGVFLLFDDIPGILASESQCGKTAEQMGFTGAEFRLNPIPLANRIVFSFPLPRGSHIARDVREEWPDRIDLEFLYGLQLWLASLATGLGVRVGPDMFFQGIDGNDLVRDRADLGEVLSGGEKVVAISHGNSSLNPFRSSIPGRLLWLPALLLRPAILQPRSQARHRDTGLEYKGCQAGLTLRVNPEDIPVAGGQADRQSNGFAGLFPRFASSPLMHFSAHCWL